MNSRSADFCLSASSNNIFTYDKETCEWSQRGDNTGCFDDQPACGDWMLTDFPNVGFDFSDQCMNQDISISGYENSRVDTNQQPALPSWSLIQNSDSRANSPPKSADLQVCRVCNDTASGTHFGVMSCEACKSFFRRSIRAEAKYVCRGNKCCEINKNTRNRCQHCRLQQCVDVGMRKNDVQEERTPYPIKERKLSTRCTKSTTGSVQHSPTIARNFGAMGTSIPFPFYSFGSTPVNMVNTSFNNDAKDQAISTSAMLEILRKADEAENSMVLPSPLARSDRKLPDSKKRSLLSVISWAKKLPMFTQLPVDDQIKLIKKSWSEVNTLKLVHPIIKFPDGAFKSDESTHLYLTDDPVVVSSIQNVIKESTSTMQEIRLDETELSCLKLITLMNPIIQNLTASGQKETEHAQDAGLKLLEFYVEKSKLCSSQRMAKLLLFHGQVKALTKDIMKIEEKQSFGSEGDVALLELLSQSI